MKTSLIAKLFLISGCAFLYQIPVSAQEWVPELTEQWEPVPDKVTPGQGTKPPSDAIVLFDGTDLSAWESSEGGPALWKVTGGAMTVVPGTGDIRTKQEYGDIQLHIEWKAPFKVQGDGQGHGNSGIFLQDRYEVQVLDCYENKTYVNGQTASVYKQYAPLVNACLPTGEWEVYDIIYTAPRFNDDGSLFSPARLTLLQNGVLVQNNVEIRGNTEYIGLPAYTAHGLKQPLRLQDHGNAVSYRNIWLREL